MRVLGLTITRQKQMLSPVENRGGWWPIVREPFGGAWQRNLEINVQDVLTYSIVWACVTLIASDIAKLWIKLVEKDSDGIWTETQSPAFSPVLRKPNRFQTRIKFIEYWILSKLIRGNTYVLKQRDERGVVVALYILDPGRVKVLVAPDGAVYYQIAADHLSGLDDDSVTVPAREIIHDIMVPLYHPLVGVSPIHACGLAAMQGLKIQGNSEQFFANQSQPGGLLIAPGPISEINEKRLQAYWEGNYTGVNAGRVAVLSDNMKYEPLSVNANDAQLIEQLKWTGETVCSCFHVPPWKVGVGPLPPYGNVQAANIEYYSQALQCLIENLELCLDEGLELPRAPRELGVELDLDALLRMDTATQMDIATKGVGGGVLKPNEGRAAFDKKPVPGGDAVYLQQQWFSLEALSERDRDKPFSKPEPATPATPAVSITDDDDEEKMFTSLDLIVSKGMQDFLMSDAWT